MDKDCRRAPIPAPKAKAQPAPAGKGKGKGGKGGKGKGKGKTFFDGLCRRCGWWGHKEVTCREVMSIEGEELGPGSVNIMSEVLNVGSCGSDSGVLLLIDSGACLSVCPRDWCYVLAADASRDEIPAGGDGYGQAAYFLWRPDGAVRHVGGRPVAWTSSSRT